MSCEASIHIIFLGLSDSYESFYQAVRRCWRFGQEKEVNVYIIISQKEGLVKNNIERKEKESQRMINEMVFYTKDILSKELKNITLISKKYKTNNNMIIPEWLKGEIYASN